MRVLRLILLAPLLLLLVVFALSNMAMVPVGLWPTGITVAVPLSVAVLIGMAIAFMAGAIMAWFGSLPHRRRARRAEARAAALQAELDQAHRRALVPAPAPLPPSTPASPVLVTGRMA